MRCAFLLVVGGCLSNPTVEVDQQSLAIPRGLSHDLSVMVDGEPQLRYVLWEVEDPKIATVTPSLDGHHLRIGGNREGDTIVRVGTHGEIFDIPTHIDPPAIVQLWIEPSQVVTSVGELVPLRATGLDSVLAMHDISRDSQWAVRDPAVASLDMTGMMLEATAVGATTVTVAYGELAALAPITIYK